MKTFRGIFSIIEEKNCPLYEVGEKLVLSDKTILCPLGKEVCLILVRDMTQLLFHLLKDEGKVGNEKDENFNCSGCKGLIKFIRLPVENREYAKQGRAVTAINQASRGKYEKIIDSPFFKMLLSDQIGTVFSYFKEILLDQGTVLIRKGEQNLNFYFVFEGELLVQGDGIILETLVDGEFCGEMSYLGHDVAVATVRAAKKTKVLAIAGDIFSSLLGNNALVQNFIAQILAKRLRRTHEARARYVESCMSGRLDHIVPAELFQVFHMHKKTGVLAMELEAGTGKVSFREGCLINASYAGEKNQGAIYKMLAENKGVYRFTTGLSPQEMKAGEIGDFMVLLMEGVKRVDENMDD